MTLARRIWHALFGHPLALTSNLPDSRVLCRCGVWVAGTYDPELDGTRTR
jgi:hypothetical protein